MNTSSSTSTNELCWCLRCFDFPEDFKEIDETTARLTADPENNKQMSWIWIWMAKRPGVASDGNFSSYLIGLDW